MSEMLVVEQLLDTANGNGNGAPFILDRHGRKMPGRDDERRTAELREGLTRHEDVRTTRADVSTEHVERVLSALHEPSYLEALRQVDWHEPRMMPEWAPPGLPADSPVWAGVYDTAFEGVRTAMTAATAIVDGEQFSYALCRPPGPPRRAGLPRRLLLPEHGRGGGIHAVGRRGERRLHPRPRLPLPHGHRSDRGPV